MLQIITNHHERQFKYFDEVPSAIISNQFDHLDCNGLDMDGFFEYRNYWYHTSDFMRVGTQTAGNASFSDWHGYHGDSFFSGVLIKLSDDGETYQIATYLS